MEEGQQYPHPAPWPDGKPEKSEDPDGSGEDALDKNELYLLATLNTIEKVKKQGVDEVIHKFPYHILLRYLYHHTII